MKILKLFLIPILVVFVLRIIFVIPFWEKIESKAKDNLFLIRGNNEISGDVVIVHIGDDTFKSLDEQWPFPRDYYAHLIDNLEKAGAREIVFDIEFTEASNKESDELLAMTAAKYDNVLFAGKISKEIKANYTKEQIIPPINEITRRKLNWGTVNISSDTDGFVRRYDLFQKKGDQEKYSLSVMAIAHLIYDKDIENKLINSGKSLQIGDKIIPKVSRKSCLINYYGPAYTFKTIDFANVLDDSTFEISGFDWDAFNQLKKDNVFRDKIVLIGVTGDEFHDAHYTPFQDANNQSMPGVEIHANFIEMVLNNNYLYEFSYLHFVLIFFIIAIIIFFANRLIKPTVSIIYTLVFIILSLAISYFLFAKKNTLIPLLEIPVLLLILYLIGLISQYIKSIKEKKFIKKAFGQYIAPELVNELIKDPKNLEYGGSLREITVLFSDIRSFTPYSESHSPKEVVSILQEYLTAMVDIIIKNKGTLDKFVGDEIMALYGAPLEIEDHAYWACKTAYEMRLYLNKLQEKWKKEGKDIFEIGVGINTGTATVGNLGSEQIFDYTAIGDTINAGARLEAINKNYDTKNHIIISNATYQKVKDKVDAKFLDDVIVKGKKQSIKIYEVLGMKD
ncbi:MAG: adenylate/guanylate cyclase domain-containing protein [Candidatus Cloacimonetes bacterium]|nr:adenylate/guanylate cyclase domain-containing protein [Candidatus Cloacimonadota bacterium]